MDVVRVPLPGRPTPFDPPVRVVAIDTTGWALALSERGLVELYWAVVKHVIKLRGDGFVPPSDLEALAAVLAPGGSLGRAGGREAGHSEPLVISYSQASKVLGVSSRTLRRWRHDGRIGGAGRKLLAADVREVRNGRREAR